MHNGNELGWSSKLGDTWTRNAQGNGARSYKDQIKFKGNRGQEEKFCSFKKFTVRI